jgi:hypothetical protein
MRRVPDLICTNGCGPLAAVVMVRVDGLPHADARHYRFFTYTAVDACTVCGVGVLEWFDHDCTGYPTSHALPVEASRLFRLVPSDVDQLRAALDACPEPDSGHCGCPAHESLADSLADVRAWSTDRAVLRLVDGRPSLAPGPT